MTRTPGPTGRNVRILICAGGTGGHVYPALAAADSLRESRATAGDLELLWVGSVGGMERKMVIEAGIKLETILAGGVVGKGLSGGLIGLVKLAAGAGQQGSIRTEGLCPQAQRWRSGPRSDRVRLE